MSPPPATRHDAAGVRFLDAAADLIEAYLQDNSVRPLQFVKLRRFRFPATLGWLRYPDVIKLAKLKANGARGTSKEAFYERWPSKDDFLRDAVVHTMTRIRVNTPDTFAVDQSKKVSAAEGAPSLSSTVIDIADGLLYGLAQLPRSYLIFHLGPLLAHHKAIYDAVLEAMRNEQALWAAGYNHLLSSMGLALRPEWSTERFTLALQELLDGALLRWRAQAEDYRSSQWEGASLFADTIIAVLIGAIDWERSGEPGRAALDKLVAQHGS